VLAHYLALWLHGHREGVIAAVALLRACTAEREAKRKAAERAETEEAARRPPPATHAQDVLLIAARQSSFDGWVSFAGEGGRSKAAARLYAEGRLERTRARLVRLFGRGWAYRIPRGAIEAGGQP